MLNSEQKTELTQAILSATKYGACEYADNNRNPVCVVGHLCYNRGVPGKFLRDLGPQSVDLLSNPDFSNMRIRDFDIDLLTRLQRIWDQTDMDDNFSDSNLTETEARMAMLFLVEEATDQ